MKTPEQIRKEIISLVHGYIKDNSEHMNEELNQNSVIIALVEGASAMAVDYRIAPEGLVHLVTHFHKIYTEYVRAVEQEKEELQNLLEPDSKNKELLN